MEVTYDLSPDSYTEFAIRSMKKIPVVRVTYFVIWCGVPVVFCAAATAIILGVDVGWWWALAALLALIGLLYPIVHPLWYWDQLAKNMRSSLRRSDMRGVIGKITLVMNDETFAEITAVTRTEVRWADILLIESDEDFTVIHVNSIRIALLPRRGFIWDGDYERTRDFALARFGPKLEGSRIVEPGVEAHGE